MTAADARRLALYIALLAVAVVLTVFALADLVFNGLDLLALIAWVLVFLGGWKL